MIQRLINPLKGNTKLMSKIYYTKQKHITHINPPIFPKYEHEENENMKNERKQPVKKSDDEVHEKVSKTPLANQTTNKFKDEHHDVELEQELEWYDSFDHVKIMQQDSNNQASSTEEESTQEVLRPKWLFMDSSRDEYQDQRSQVIGTEIVKWT